MKAINSDKQQKRFINCDICIKLLLLFLLTSNIQLLHEKCSLSNWENCQLYFYCVASKPSGPIPTCVCEIQDLKVMPVALIHRSYLFPFKGLFQNIICNTGEDVCYLYLLAAKTCSLVKHQYKKYLQDKITDVSLILSMNKI